MILSKLTSVFLLLMMFNVAALSADPSGKTILTISAGLDSKQHSVSFDMAALKALPASTIITSTTWTKGPQTFKGVKLTTLLEYVGFKGETLSAIALNDYSVELPRRDVSTKLAMVAYEQNEKPLLRRLKGPLWIVYPQSDFPELNTPIFHERWIWQLNKIIVK